MIIKHRRRRRHWSDLDQLIVDDLVNNPRWLKSQDEFRAEIGRFRIQQLELLGLLAAVVAFVATAGNIAAHSSGRDGVRVMTVMSGSVILVFSVFSLMSSRTIRRVLLAVMLGIALLMLGLIAPRGLVR